MFGYKLKGLKTFTPFKLSSLFVLPKPTSGTVTGLVLRPASSWLSHPIQLLPSSPLYYYYYILLSFQKESNSIGREIMASNANGVYQRYLGEINEIMKQLLNIIKRAGQGT